MVEEESKKPTQELEDICLVERDTTKVTKVRTRLDSDLRGRNM